ncbi:MAG: hypothetical protein AB1898_17040 [Acidobacteriota bacterium]
MIFWCAVLVLTFALPAPSQVRRYSVTGHLSLGSNRPGNLDSSLVVEARPADGQSQAVRAVVNAEGDFQFSDLRAGAYVLTASAKGYRSLKVNFDIVGTGQIRGNLRLVLEPETSPAGTLASSVVGTVSQNELRAPGSAVRSVERAERLLAAGELGTAMEAVEDSLRLYPEYARADLVKGRILERQQKFTEANRCYRKAIENDSHCYPAYFALAERYRVEGNQAALQEISVEWKKAQSLDAAPYYYSAISLFEAGDFESAVQEAQFARKFPHDHIPHLPLLLANCYLKLHDPAAAAVQIEEFLAAAPNDPLAEQARRTLRSVKEILNQQR